MENLKQNSNLNVTDELMIPSAKITSRGSDMNIVLPSDNITERGAETAERVKEHPNKKSSKRMLLNKTMVNVENTGSKLDLKDESTHEQPDGEIQPYLSVDGHMTVFGEVKQDP